ncbi:MAG: collagen-like protein [Planctomycetota bacterium]
MMLNSKMIGVAAAMAATVLGACGLAQAAVIDDQPASREESLAALKLAASYQEDPSSLRDAYALLVYNGSERQARVEAEIAEIEAKVRAAVASGRITQEQADQKLQGVYASRERWLERAFLVEVQGLSERDAGEAVRRSQIEAKVASGDLSRDQADRLLERMQSREGRGRPGERGARGGRDGRGDPRLERALRDARQRVRAAVESGDLTPEEARAKLQETERGMRLRLRLSNAKSDIEKKVEAGELTPEEGEAKIKAMYERARAQRGEREPRGDRGPRGERGPRGPRGDRGPRGGEREVPAALLELRMELGAALKAGEITREEARAKFEALREELGVEAPPRRRGGDRRGPGGPGPR